MEYMWIAYLFHYLTLITLKRMRIYLDQFEMTYIPLRHFFQYINEKSKAQGSMGNR